MISFSFFHFISSFGITGFSSSQLNLYHFFDTCFLFFLLHRINQK
nr:MAG TPA: hypothetical protein [Caudoviricetes sp.]